MSANALQLLTSYSDTDSGDECIGNDSQRLVKSNINSGDAKDKVNVETK